MSTPTPAPLICVQIGTPRPLGCEGQMSAIWKFPVFGKVEVGREGLAGDAQADRRVHGGPEKAVHQYAFHHYEAWRKRFPQAAPQLLRGSFGENLSTDEHDETNVFIGDCFAIGTAVLQVCQPRRPCWKLDHRFVAPGLASAMQETGWSGWYFRVVEPGTIEVGNAMTLVERLPGAISLADFWRLFHAPGVDADALSSLRGLPGLASNWVKKITDRLTGAAANDDLGHLHRATP